MISEKIKMQHLHTYNERPDFNGRTLNIEIISSCNEECIYCPDRAMGIHKNRHEINEDFFYKITKEARELGITDVGLYISGEPLLNKNICKYISHLKSVGFEYVYISTNGLLLNETKLKELVSAGCDSIKFSVGGYDRDSYKRTHGIDCWDIVYKNIKGCYQYRLDNGLDYKIYMFCIVTNFTCDYKDVFYEKFNKFVDELVIGDCEICPGIDGMERLAVKEIGQRFQTLRVVPCDELFNRIVIDDYGYLLGCCNRFGGDETIIADLNNVSLREALYSEDFVNMRRRHINGDIENTICDFCINNRLDNIKPMSSKYDVQMIKKRDINEEISIRYD